MLLFTVSDLTLNELKGIPEYILVRKPHEVGVGVQASWQKHENAGIRNCFIRYCETIDKRMASTIMGVSWPAPSKHPTGPGLP